MAMIPTEPIGSIPRSSTLMKEIQTFADGRISSEELESFYEAAIRDTINLFEATGSPVITDGEQSKPSFATYPIHGLENLAPDGVKIIFADGHVRQLPRLTAGPFRYKVYADTYLEEARKYAHVPVKQAVISASAISLIYPQNGIKGYSREVFLQDLVQETAKDIRRCLQKGAYNVQIDFIEGRLAVKLDPGKQLLQQFIQLNNRVLDLFSVEERSLIGIHTCPGGDRDSTHSLDVDYADLLPYLFDLKAKNFYMQLASEPDSTRVLKIVKECMKPDQRIFVGVIDPLSPRIETPEEVSERIVEATEFIPLEQLGTTDDCGFSPFRDDTSTARKTAFAKIKARVDGTAFASQKLGVS
jgi:5-methyltetrahydropteroyltriglutamate--homocysteine methyltransferase